jgi:hypothetical protein
MATAARAPHYIDNEIKLSPTPQLLSLRFTTGKPVQSKFPGGRNMFTTVDERKIFLNDEETSEFEHLLLDKGIQPVDFIRVSRVSHGRGGGFSIRVERVPDAEENDAREPARNPHADAIKARISDLTAQLEESLRIAREQGPTAFHAPKPREAAPLQETASRSSRTESIQQLNDTPAPALKGGGMTGLLAGALIASINAYNLASEYARQKGTPIEFTGEDIRCSATAMLIQYWKDGGTR